jgi:transposase
MEQPTRFVGMDVHKDTIVVAVTSMGDVGKATFYGTIPNTTAALEKLVQRLRQAGSGPLKFCYEACPRAVMSVFKCCGRRIPPRLVIPVALSNAGMRGGGRALSDG